MTSTVQTSLKEIVTRYRHNQLREELRGDWGAVVFYRLPAFLLARIALALGVSAMAITGLSLILMGLVVVLAVLQPLAPVLPLVAAVSFIFCVLDNTDGIVARESKDVRLSGAYLDFMADVLHRAVLLAAIGFITDQDYPAMHPSWLAIGMASGFLATFARLNRSHMLTYRPARKSENTKEPSLFVLGYRFLSGLDTLLPVLALLAWQWSLQRELLLWLLFYTSADAIIAVVSNYRELSSQHDAKTP